MGIFSKKPPCPICGGKVSRFLPTKVEGEYICDECSGKLDMDDDIRSGLTMQGLREYLTFMRKIKLLDQALSSVKRWISAFSTPN